ncbi:PREDICTED: toll-like receptor 4 isoform X2 [Crocodylus porosus]|nr:PREDICTED: toll-like receptor 4 isoform X2 [Crocodylus porosus]
MVISTGLSHLEDAQERVCSSSTLFTLSLVMPFLSQCAAGKFNPCLEVVPGLTYRCMDLNLSRVPTEIPSSTQNLDLSFNPLGSLGSNNFAAVPALKFLDLARCCLQTIENYAFEDLCNLSTLILTGNPLQYLGPSAFFGLTSLQRLIAVETNIFSLADLPIRHLHTLEELNVANNHIDSLTLPKYFTSLTSLRFLSLQSNRISYISKGQLDVLQERKGPYLTLVLSLNDIKYIQPGAFEGIQLQELSLRACFNNFTVMKDCLQGLAGLQVNRLILGEYRNIGRVENFQNGLLDGLCQVQMQEFVFISFERFQNHTDTVFECLLNVSSIRFVDLYLAQVSTVPEFSKVQSLECKLCKFKEVPAVKLSLFRKLRVLRITKSKYLTNFLNGFKDLPSLEVLDLSENRLSLTRCCSSHLAGAPNLKHLNLSFNYFISLKEPFGCLNGLLSLDFQHSILKDFGVMPLFRSLTNLTYLDISYTGVQILCECVFWGLESLQVLKMAGNSFKDNSLASNFRNLTQLRTLDVSSCKLLQVSSSTFADLQNLQNLNISNNRLKTLDTTTYLPLQALTVLDFSNNQLTFLMHTALQNLADQLIHLDLSHNMFDCSCSHLSFFEWVKKQEQLLQNTERMVCSSPVNMKNVTVLNFDLSYCQLSITLVAVSASMALVAVLIMFLIYKYYFHLYYAVVLLSGCKHSSERGDTYDAFVIHSSKDVDWVKEELVKTLEEGVPPFRLCLHYRDFEPGVPIISNIVQEGFLSSRKVIAVISSHFLESHWCKFEFEIAQSWQFVEGKAGIILIVLEELDKAMQRRLLGLSRYLRRNTYLEWKDKEISKHIFWRQLRTALLDGKTWTHEEVKQM